MTDMQNATDELVSLLISTSENASVVEYRMDSGTCVGVGLMWDKRVSIQRAFLPKGSCFPEHTHNEVEWLIVYDGSLITIIDGVETTNGVGQGIMIPIGSTHSCKANEDTWVIGITIPSSEGYPGVK
jgi:quercetin dioxygenase-like cupin family protein